MGVGFWSGLRPVAGWCRSDHIASARRVQLHASISRLGASAMR
jgi:hypothetical protein